MFLCRMVLEWREGEHSDVEEAMQGDLMAQQALRSCGFVEAWKITGNNSRDSPQ